MKNKTMKNIKKLIFIFFALITVLSVFVGCIRRAPLDNSSTETSNISETSNNIKNSSTKTEENDDTHTHKFGKWTTINSSSHARTCPCGEKETAAHVFDSGKVTTKPTANSDGIMTYTCTKCSVTKTQIIEKSQHIHNFGNWSNSNASFHSRSCSCGEKETENHSFDSGKVTKQPTENTTGIKTFTCTKCKATKTETIENLQHTHSFGNWTNSNKASHLRSCSCGEKETESHIFDSGKVTTAPTINSTGIKTYTCTKCKSTKTEIIEKLQHTHSFGGWTKNDCTYHSRYCSCGEYETEQHSFDAGKITVEPTCTSEGVITYTCYICGATATASIPKTDPPKTDPPYIDTDIFNRTWEYDKEQICYKCGQNDGSVHYSIPSGTKVDTSWTCSSCGTYNESSASYNVQTS